MASLFEKRAEGLYHNTAAIIDADGSVLGIYGSFALDLPTGAAVVATFGLLLVGALVLRRVIPDTMLKGTQ